jgi:uncharacterized protein
VISAPDAALIVGAGVLAGVVGTAGGITSLVSYPALLAIGVPAFAANVANIVALVALWPGSAVASRPELAGRRSWLWRWTPVAAIGGGTGALLLLVTPAQAFDQVVPYLVAAGALVLLLQPAISARRARQPQGRGPVLFSGLFAIGAYGGYFGAGSGVMTLGLMLVTVDDQLARANALKNMLVGAATVASAVILVAVVPVDWVAVVPLATGMLAGSLIGPRLVRRLPAGVLRWFAALLGLGLAVKLWLDPA